MSAKQHSDLKLHLHHAPIEIERKSLIANHAWKHCILRSVTHRDGLIAVPSKVCPDETLEKQRYFVEHAGAIWHVDVYGGVLQGIVIAEIELEQEGQKVVLPTWIGKEITGDAFYKKINMVAARRATRP